MDALRQQNEGVGGMRTTHTGVNNEYGGRKPGLTKQKIMIEPGVYQTRTAALNVQYHGFDDNRDCDHPLKVKITMPEKWLDNPTPVSTLKAFFLKSYRKKFPEAPLSKLPDEEVDLSVKDESMFVFSKKKLSNDAIVHTTFYDRQDIWAMSAQDWKDMDDELKKYRRAIVRALAHCHRSATDSWQEVIPVTTSRQLAPTNSYVIFVGWYKMQCVIVKPDMTIADLKCYLHEKNGARMPLECIDIGVRSGDDIRIIDDALTLEQVYVRAMTPGPEPDFGTGPGTLVDLEKAEEAEKLRKAEEEIEANKGKRGMGAGDKHYFKRHETTSRVHADWDNEESELKTFAINDQPHQKGVESDLIGPQMPMHLRTTHKPRVPSKYDHLTADGETTAFLDHKGEYAERPVVKESEVEAARQAAVAKAKAEATSKAKEASITVEEVADDVDRIVDVTDGEPAGATASKPETLAGLEPESGGGGGAAAAAAAAAEAEAEEGANSEMVAAHPFMGKTLVLGVGKRIQDEKHKIWVASVHDPYSFRGPEDKATGGGQKDSLDLQMNGAPKGWSAPAEGQAAVNSDANCSIM